MKRKNFDRRAVTIAISFHHIIDIRLLYEYFFISTCSIARPSKTRFRFRPGSPYHITHYNSHLLTNKNKISTLIYQLIEIVIIRDEWRSIFALRVVNKMQNLFISEVISND